MSEVAIRFRYEKTVTLDPLWYDDGWYHELRADGLTPERTDLNDLGRFWEAVTPVRRTHSTRPNTEPRFTPPTDEPEGQA